ncbi:sulfotransferase family protein [Litorisediminicola beolgyonensis]|uniref:Sulfotransferase family protein n=1 Tax=Litorisediminicola beolgyonensis TaxID=1173614 RepID=A0ABW3ZIS5_9RHOB
MPASLSPAQPSRLRPLAKSAAATVARQVLPQARYSRCILLLSHMRATTTALGNVLGSHPAISGYGESHVRHDCAGAPAALAVNLARRGCLSLGAPYLFDKVLHDRLDDAVSDDFYTARALMLLRAPGPSIASILKLAAATGLREGATPETAARYYAARVTRLCTHWDRFPREARMGVSTAELRRDPDAVVGRIGAGLSLSPPLGNHYRSSAASRRAGGGDPLKSGRFSRIEPGQDEPCGDMTVVPPGLAARCQAAHDALLDRFQRG